jgi:hypothetical protein
LSMRKIIIVLGITAVLMIFIFLCAGTPFILNFAKHKIESVVNTQINAPIHIGSIRGNLFYTIEATDVTIGKAIELNKLRVSYNIFRIVSKEIVINQLVVDGLDIDADQADTLIQNFIVPKQLESKDTSRPFRLFIRKISLVNSSIHGQIVNRRIDCTLKMAAMIQPQGVILDTLAIMTDNSRIYTSGYVPFTENEVLDVDYHIQLSLEEFYFEGVNGRLTSNGRVSGQITAPQIYDETELYCIYNTDTLAGTIATTWQVPHLDSLTIAAKLSVKTPSLQKSKEQHDEWRLSITTYGRRFLAEIISSYGKVGFEGYLSGEINDPDLAADFNGAFRFMSFNPRIKGRIRYVSNKLLIDKGEIASHKIRAYCNALVVTSGPQEIKADFNILCSDISIINTFLKSPLPVSGKLSITTKARGTILAPVATGKVELEDADVFSEKIIEAAFKFDYRRDTIHVDSGYVASNRGVIELAGLYSIVDSAFELDIGSKEISLQPLEIFGSDTIPLNGSIGFDIELFGKTYNPVGKGILILQDFVYDTLRFGDYSLEATIQDHVVNLHIMERQLTLEALIELQGDPPYPFNGRLDLKHFDIKTYIPASEAFVSAQIKTHGEVSTLNKTTALIKIDTIFAALPQSTICNAEAIEININQEMIDIISCVMEIQSQKIFLKGQVPLDINAGNLSMKIKTSKVEISNLSMILPDMPAIRGLFSVDIDIKGPIKAPQIDGQLILEDLVYSVPGINFDSVFCWLTFNNKNINIERMIGKINSGSFSINGHGSIAKDGIDNASIDITTDRIDIKNKEYGSAIISSVLHASSRKDSVRIIGEITLDKAVYDVPFDHQSIINMLTRVNQPPPEQADFLKRIYCDIGVSAKKGIHIKNNIADIPADVDLQIKGYFSRINIYGTIATSGKGSVKYLGKQFDISNAHVYFDNPYEINPVIDLTAINYVSSEDENYEIILQVSGTVKDWRLVLNSVPPLPEQDIISLLIIGKRRPTTLITKSGKGIDLKGAVKDYAMDIARGAIKKQTEEKLSLDKVTITGDLLKPRELDIGIEKKLGKKFTLIYGTGLESWELRRIGINYDLTDILSIFTLHDQESKNSSIDLDIHFELK